MKNVTLLLLFAFIFITPSPLQAQKEWKWTSHGIAFSTPADFKIIKNEAKLFTAENQTITLSMAPWQDEAITEEAIANALVKLAVEMKYDGITEAHKLEFDNFIGYGINGTKDGENAAMVILLDTKSSTNIVIVITFPNKSEEAASKILSSLHTIKQ